MEGELTVLEERVEGILGLCHRLHAENQALRNQIAGLEDERRRLSDKIDAAATRLEELMEHLPNEVAA